MGIQFWFSGGHNNTVTGNIISKNVNGIKLFGYDNQSNTITYNKISYNFLGLQLFDSLGNIIKHNNFIGNAIDNFYQSEYSPYIKLRSNKWIENYYSKSLGLKPKPIFGIKLLEIPCPSPSPGFIWKTIRIPWFPLYDKNPAKEPYDIEV